MPRSERATEEAIESTRSRSPHPSELVGRGFVAVDIDIDAERSIFGVFDMVTQCGVNLRSACAGQRAGS